MILGYHVGKRDRESAQTFVRDLSNRIDGRCQLTTDGLKWYPPAVEQHVAGRADYAQLVKLYSTSDFPGPEWYSQATRVTGTIKTVQDGRPDQRYISTSHIERFNLSIRQHLRRFARLTLGYSKKLARLRAAIDVFMAWYCFCRTNMAHRVTPAMEARLTTRIWSLEELLCDQH